MLIVSTESSYSRTLYEKFMDRGPSLVSLVASAQAALGSWPVYSSLSLEGLCYSIGLGCPIAVGALLLLPEGPLELAFTVINLTTPYFAAPTVVLKTAIFTANMIVFKNVIRVAAPDL